MENRRLQSLDSQSSILNSYRIKVDPVDSIHQRKHEPSSRLDTAGEMQEGANHNLCHRR
jgi:hypothetical protein